MKKNAFVKALPHACIIFAVLMLLLLIVDNVNSAMNFINHPLTKSIMFIFSILVIIESVILVAHQRRRQRKR